MVVNTMCDTSKHTSALSQPCPRCDSTPPHPNLRAVSAEVLPRLTPRCTGAVSAVSPSGLRQVLAASPRTLLAVSAPTMRRLCTESSTKTAGASPRLVSPHDTRLHTRVAPRSICVPSSDARGREPDRFLRLAPIEAKLKRPEQICSPRGRGCEMGRTRGEMGRTAADLGTRDKNGIGPDPQRKTAEGKIPDRCLW